MNLKIGDFVQIVDDTLEGVIIKVRDNLVQIKDRDDFLHEYKIHQIVKIKQPLDIYIDSKKVEQIAFEEKSIPNSRKSSSSKKSKKIPEIDLHIHELTDSTKKMTDYDMLQLQLETAEKRLKRAIENKEKKLIFIHGVGKGRLRNELSILFQRYKEVDYYDADFLKYGRGATEVYIYENRN